MNGTTDDDWMNDWSICYIKKKTKETLLHLFFIKYILFQIIHFD